MYKYTKNNFCLHHILLILMKTKVHTAKKNNNVNLVLYTKRTSLMFIDVHCRWYLLCTDAATGHGNIFVKKTCKKNLNNL